MNPSDAQRCHPMMCVLDIERLPALLGPVPVVNPPPFAPTGPWQILPFARVVSQVMTTTMMMLSFSRSAQHPNYPLGTIAELWGVPNANFPLEFCPCHPGSPDRLWAARESGSTWLAGQPRP